MCKSGFVRSVYIYKIRNMLILVEKCLIFSIISGSFVEEPWKCFESVRILLLRTLIVNFSVTFSQDLLTRHKALVAEYLEQNYDAVSDFSDKHILQHYSSTPQRICLDMCKVLLFHVILNQRHHTELASCLPPPPSPDHSSHVAHAAFSHRALFGSVNINTARDPKRGNTRRYTDRSGISHVSAQWPSHISKKRSVSLNALWSGSKKRKVRPIRFLENKIGGKPC